MNRDGSLGKRAWSLPKRCEDWTPPVLWVVGIGTGVHDCSLTALECIEKAEVLVGGRRHLDLFSGFSAQRIPISGPLEELLERLRILSKERRVAVLASGDPLFFGIGRRLAAFFGPDRLRFLPAPTAIQSLCHRIGHPWDDVQVVSLHGRGPTWEWMWELRRGKAVAFFTDARCSPDWVAESLLRAGFGDLSMWVGEDLGLPSEQVRCLLPKDASRLEFSPLNVVLVTPDSPRFSSKRREDEPLFGIPDGEFSHEKGLITKREVRSVILGMLHLRPGMVVWDLGAGSGAVAVEAARLIPLRSVWAVERRPERVRRIRENVRRFRCGEVQALEGEVGEVMEALPDPDRIFIGGAGGRLDSVLLKAWDRLKSGGRIVCSVVTFRSLEAVEAFGRDKNVAVETVQVHVSRAVPIGTSRRLESLNPVFLCAMEKKKEKGSDAACHATEEK